MTREITIETEERIVLRGGAIQRATVMWCPACRGQVVMVTPEQAAQIASVSRHTIFRWTEAGNVHFIEECGHPLVICRDSLIALQTR